VTALVTILEAVFVLAGLTFLAFAVLAAAWGAACTLARHRQARLAARRHGRPLRWGERKALRQMEARYTDEAQEPGWSR
jgi:hypothetical protein